MSDGSHACYPHQADFLTSVCQNLCGHEFMALGITNMCGLCGVAVDQLSRNRSAIGVLTTSNLAYRQ
jgi:hypothetical protein